MRPLLGFTFEVQHAGAHVFETTQLIKSMLGLLAFPREEFIDRFPRRPNEHGS